jgi:hypothetical protein
VGVWTLNASDALPDGPVPPPVCLRYAGAAGETAEVNAILAAARDADVALLADGARVGAQWLERMRAAAHCDSTVVSASALCDHGGALAVPVSPAALPELRARRADPQTAAAAVADASALAYPRIDRPEGPCVYVRREALELLGGLDERLGVALALSEMGARALERGMLNVAADDVFVMNAPPPPGGPALDPPAAEGSEEHGVLCRCLDTAQVALDGLWVTIDARALGPVLAGTQVYTIELVLALARLQDVALRVVVPPDLSPEATAAFAGVPAVELVSYADAARGELHLSHIVHRPQQVFSEDDLALLRMLGRRIVVGQQDLIAYRNPAYHPDPRAWREYRRVTRLALAVADRAVFFSRHALLDTVGEDLIERSRAVEAGIGGDELLRRDAATPARPPELSADETFLLCLATDYRHKNRPFAIALLAALHASGEWSGRLVLAGGHAAHGSSAEEERDLLAAHPQLTGAVVDLGAVSEATRSWLMAHARAVLYPSLYEGFGLLPLEAARAGIPCLFAPQASLGDGRVAEAATLVAWDASASARAVLPLLADGPPRAAHMEMLGEMAASRSWAEVARDLRTSYGELIASPHRASAPRIWREQEREREIGELRLRLRALRDSVGVLAGPADGGLLSDAERQGLVRLAARPLLRRLLFAPVRLLGRRW